MYCPHCMKKIPNTTDKCIYCNQATHTPMAGMSTLRVSCRVHLPVWMMIVQPFNYFQGYKVYISVDDQDYVLKSKKKQIDIPVSVGTHYVRISSMSKKSAKALKFGGIAMAFAGAVAGSGATVYAGADVEDLGDAVSKEGKKISFASDELKAVSVKLAWNGSIVEDKE